MANEFKHKDPGSTLTSAEFIAACGDGHIFACQATGDIVYASSTTVLSKLAKGAANTVLHMGGSCIPAWTASPSVTDLTIGGGCITLTGAATDIDLIDNNASALSFDASGQAGILEIVTTDCSEAVKLAGILDVNSSIDFDGTTVAACASGAITLTSTSSSACGIYLRANGGTSETVKIHSDQGTSVTEGAASVSLLSDAGGVELRSTANLANAVNITNDGGTSGTITLFNDQGTSVTEGAASIALVSDAGGVELRSTADLANAINITNDGGTSGTITLFNDQGTAVNEGVASIQLLSDVGGIGIKSGLNAAGAIRLTADAGTSETIILHADQGSGAASICLTSDAGGITLTPSSAVTVSGALTVGVDDTGHDVTFFGAAAGAYMLYDQSCNLLEVRGATAAGPGHLKLTTGEATVVACDVLGKIEFQAPAECGTDAIVAGANIQAVAQATFSATVNNTDLLFMTGLSGAATEKFRFTANGELGVGGANYGTCGQVLTSGGAGAAPSWAAAGGSDISVRVTDAGTQSIANSTLTPIDFDTSYYDTNAMHTHDCACEDHKLVAKTAGKYLITTQQSFASNSSGRRYLAIRQCGSTLLAVQEFNANSASATRMQITTQACLQACEYVCTVMFQSSGGSLATVKCGEGEPLFAMMKVLG